MDSRTLTHVVDGRSDRTICGLRYAIAGVVCYTLVSEPENATCARCKSVGSAFDSIALAAQRQRIAESTERLRRERIDLQLQKRQTERTEKERRKEIETLANARAVEIAKHTKDARPRRPNRPPASGPRERRLRQIQDSARDREIECSLTIYDVKARWSGPCVYCGHHTEGCRLDRVDSDRGYTPENVVLCCTTCNLMKRDHDVNTWLEHVARIARYRRL